MSELNNNSSVEPQHDQTSVASIHFSIPQLIVALIGTNGVVISAVFGAGWYLYTEGVFTPDEEARRTASQAQYALEKAQADLSVAREKNDSLTIQLSTSVAEASKLAADLELKRSELDFKTKNNALVVQSIVACIAATNAGEATEGVTATETPGSSLDYQGDGSAAASAAITSVAKPQDGSKITGQCAEIFKEKIAPLLR